MAYISAEDVKAIREALKVEFGKTYKFGVKRDGSSGVRVTFKEGPAFEKATVYDRYERCEKEVDINGYEQINHYHTESFYGKENAKILDKVSEIAHTAPGIAGGRVYYDNSDAMTDYFDTAYYVSIHVGSWDKPYVCRAA
jgi:hypothetical protein